MERIVKDIYVILLTIFAALAPIAPPAWATPSSVLYTPCTPYIQPFGVPHITYDSYFNRTADFPTDAGLTIGLLPWKNFQAEIGFDLFYPAADPAQINFKAGFPEGAFGKYFPGLTAGIYSMGFHKDVNNFDILHFEAGKTLPKIGSVSIGGYRGLTPELMESAGGADQDWGYMASYYRTFEPLTDRVAFAADYMSGKNVIGGGGAGLYFWFNKSIDLILGWVWFNDRELNYPYRNGVFTIQLDVDFNLKRKLEGS